MDEIHHAILRGDLAAVRTLVDAEPERLDLTDFDARTPLILSVLAGSLPLVEYFVEGPAAAAVDEAIPPDGCSALFYACRDGRVEIARYLLAKGADPAQRNRYGTTLPMILASSAPSMPHTNHDEDDDEEENEEDGSGSGTEPGLPHAQVLRLVLRAAAGRDAGAARAGALLDARNRNGKTALVLAIEKRRPDLAACLLGAGADPFLMPAGVHHLLPLPLSPGVGTRADRAMAALLEDARQAPERVALLRRVRRMADAAHAVDKVLAPPVHAPVSGGDAHPLLPPTGVGLVPKMLAAAPVELRARLETAAAAGETPGAAFAGTVLAALPRVDLCVDGGDDDGVVGVGGGEQAAGAKRRLRLRETVKFVALDGGLKPELFVELMAMMTFPWFARVWAGEAGEEQG